PKEGYMDKVGIVLLAVVGMLVWIWQWALLGLHGLGIGERAVAPILAHIRRRWRSWNKWRKKPRNAATALQWTVRVVAITMIISAFKLTPADATDFASWLDPYQAEILGIAFTVLVIEEVERRRS